MAFKLVVSDPKTKKSYQKEVSGEGLMGKKIGEKVSGHVAGLEGYELEITGGSDQDGFPMRKDFDGIGRKRILISGPPGFHPKARGQRKRKSIRGNTISDSTAQINTKAVKYGAKTLDELFGKKEEKPSAKEEAEEKPKKHAEKEAHEAPAKEEKAEEKHKKEAPHGGEKPAEEKHGKEAEKHKEEKPEKKHAKEKKE